ncbi:MAG: anthranilate phosphoribosyltransferase [Acidobacteria bacterium]|nr:anthranilate phosphoribosyltransferase [Acidobacteriota bacterium]MBS1865141.1 anthranilate phosphoribosyltransferase [Acidobacteriota bacterium]
MSNPLIEKVEKGGVLESAEAESVMEELLGGRLETPAIVRLLRALNARPYRVMELSAFARVMRRHAARVFAEGEVLPANMVDTCGTGGDGAQTFNISTAAAIVAAAAGARVAKHGNRAASSLSGSADVLEALGVRIDLPFLETGRAIRETGIGFLFAQAAHTATRYATPARKQIGVGTVFNLLGPLTNPAGAQAQVLGVFSANVLELVAETLRELGTEHAMVIHGEGGLDEISLAGPTRIVELKEGKITRYEVTPEEFGVQRAGLGSIRGGTAKENAALIRRIFEGERGACRDIVAMNAGAALLVTGNAKTLREGAESAAEAMRSGAAKKKLEELANYGA